jgi:rare lipoprotein A
MSASGRVRSHPQVRENPRAVSYDTSSDDEANGVRPVSAYAPVDSRGPSELLSGRGLY